MNIISALIKTKKTVFTTAELYGIFSQTNKRNVDNFLYRAKKSEVLQNPYKGMRTLPNYSTFEFSKKFRPQSYISCETVLFKEGIFFQYYGNTISCVSSDSRKYKIDNKEFIYYKIQSKIRNNPIGIKDYGTYRIATPERALCDYIYINPRATIDAPEMINKHRLELILPLYPKSTRLAIQKLLDVG